MPLNASSEGDTRRNHSGMTLPSLETASFWANIAVVALTVLAAISGIFALYFSNKVGAAKDAALERFKTESATTISLADARAAEANKISNAIEHDNLVLRGDLNAEQGRVAGLQKDAADAKTAQQKVETELAKQKEKAASAEARLFELQKRHSPRMLALTKFIEDLKDKPRASAEVMYKKDDGEAWGLAWEIAGGLSGAGWRVSRPVAIPEDLTSETMSKMGSEFLRDAPLSVRIGVQPMGVTIIAKTMPDNPFNYNIPFNALTHALGESLSPISQVSGSFDSRFRDDFFRIIVMQKP